MGSTCSARPKPVRMPADVKHRIVNSNELITVMEFLKNKEQPNFRALALPSLPWRSVDNPTLHGTRQKSSLQSGGKNYQTRCGCRLDAVTSTQVFVGICSSVSNSRDPTYRTWKTVMLILGTLFRGILDKLRKMSWKTTQSRPFCDVEETCCDLLFVVTDTCKVMLNPKLTDVTGKAKRMKKKKPNPALFDEKLQETADLSVQWRHWRRVLLSTSARGDSARTIRDIF